MPDTDSVVIAKSFSYRGQPEVFTNKYHLEGTTPTTRAGWISLITEIWKSERPIMAGAVTFSTGYGYVAGNEAAAFMPTAAEITSIAGGLGGVTGATTGSAGLPPGDSAIWVRWATNDRNTKNKPIYLRKYFHGVPQESSTGDTPTAEARTAMLNHGNKMIAGTLPGGMKLCGPQGADALTPGVAQYFTTRTLKRNARTPI